MLVNAAVMIFVVCLYGYWVKRLTSLRRRRAGPRDEFGLRRYDLWCLVIKVVGWNRVVDLLSLLSGGLACDWGWF